MLNLKDFYGQRRQSKIPSEFPDKTLYPLYYQANKIEVTLNEGDMLFIPYGWFHFVFSEKVNAKTKMNVAISNWTKFHECDCQLSIDPNKYKIKCPVYNSSNEHLDELYNVHQKISQPFKVNSTLHKKYKFDYTFFNDRFKNRPINIIKSKDDFFNSAFVRYYQPERSAKYQMNFDQFFHRGISGEKLYLAQCHIGNDISFNTLPFIDNNSHNDRFLWINFANAYSNMHYDTEDNVLIQLQGTKRILLFPPSERDKLYLYNPYPPRFLCYLMSLLENNAPVNQ